MTSAELSAYVDRKSARLIEIVQDLVRTPSENTAPTGAEERCQKYAAEFLSRCGMDVSVYALSDVPGLAEHPAYWKGREYTNRPNVGARLRGSGGGRSLVLSGHVDTVPAGTLPWTLSPFSGHIEGNRLYGRGSNDMKAGVATTLFSAEALRDLGVRLRGDLVVETIVDEEFGGSNGTLAGRLMGFNGDAAVISEPSFLRVCAAQRGGRIAHITLHSAPNTGILTEGEFPAGVVHALRAFLNAVPEFSLRRRSSAPRHPMYAHHADPVPVAVTRIATGPWGTSEPTSSIEADHGLVRELSASASEVLGQAPPVAGIEGPCDMFVFQREFGIPAVLWGARGGNTHNADEYVEIDSVIDAAKVLLFLVCRWCEAG
jgi:acetylornithine deacetylase